MAQPKRRRQTKHRGNAAGMVETRGRTGRPVSPSERGGAAKASGRGGRVDRYSQPPTWKSVAIRAGITTVLFMVVIALLRKNILLALGMGVLMFLIYLPFGYYTDNYLYKRRQRSLGNKV